MSKPSAKDTEPNIGVLCWEGDSDGKSDELGQFEEIPGHFMHPDTFSFPIRFERVEGANFDTIVRDPNEEVLSSMIERAKKMEEEGIEAIATSCGFNAIFQKELADSVNIPVFTSSLLQVPPAKRMMGEDGKVGIITADEGSLSEDHLRAVGIDPSNVSIIGVQDTESFSKVREDPTADLDVEKFRREVVGKAEELVQREEKNIGAIVIECTDLPSFSSDIREKTGLPVYDIVTLTNWIYSIL